MRDHTVRKVAAFFRFTFFLCLFLEVRSDPSGFSPRALDQHAGWRFHRCLRQQLLGREFVKEGAAGISANQQYAQIAAEPSTRAKQRIVVIQLLH